MDIPDIPEPGDFIKSTQKWLSHFNVPSASPTSTVRIQAPQSSASNQVTNQSIKNKRTNKQTNERTNKQTNKETKKQRTHVQNMFYYYIILTLSLSMCIYIYIFYISAASHVERTTDACCFRIRWMPWRRWCSKTPSSLRVVSFGSIY
jgi:hypothetical protein